MLFCALTGELLNARLHEVRWGNRVCGENVCSAENRETALLEDDRRQGGSCLNQALGSTATGACGIWVDVFLSNLSAAGEAPLEGQEVCAGQRCAPCKAAAAVHNACWRQQAAAAAILLFPLPVLLTLLQPSG